MCKINENLNISNNIAVIDNLTNKKVSEIISNTLSGYTIKDFSIYKPNLAKDYEIKNIVNFMKETIENDKIPLISVTDSKEEEEDINE